jgi:hypothetical protein
MKIFKAVQMMRERVTLDVPMLNFLFLFFKTRVDCQHLHQLTMKETLCLRAKQDPCEHENRDT